MTRAEKKLTLTYERTRKIWGNEQQNPPSRFLKELPPKGIVRQTSVERPRFSDRMRDRLGVSSDSDSFAKHPLMDTMPNYEDFGDESFDETGAELRKGMRVRHPSYGVGSILSTEGSGADLKISVVFTDKTVKKFVAKYARLERV
jgi:DNA helicase-2/ATP-dependent DNA helicase PcrA